MCSSYEVWFLPRKKKKKKEILQVKWMLFKYGALSFREAEVARSLNACRLQMQKQILCRELKKKKNNQKINFLKPKQTII